MLLNTLIREKWSKNPEFTLVFKPNNSSIQVKNDSQYATEKSIRKDKTKIYLFCMQTKTSISFGFTL